MKMRPLGRKYLRTLSPFAFTFRWGFALMAFIGLSATLFYKSQKMPEATVIPSPLPQELSSDGFRLGDAVHLRVYKESLEMELWMQVAKDTKFTLFKTYPILAMSGKLGPKEKEGDHQAPEGFYSTNLGSLNPHSKFHLSFNIGYPNAQDRALGRTGSFIMVHGGALSVGCFAMGDPAIEEIYAIVEHALRNGQREVPIHSFPFRMTEQRLAQAKTSPWYEFWKELAAADADFATTKTLSKKP